MSFLTFIKDPQAVLNYSVDWSLWLAAGDTIATSAWTVPAGLTLVSQSNNATMATVVVSGGTVGVNYVITNHITTAASRQDDRSIVLQVEDR